MKIRALNNLAILPALLLTGCFLFPEDDPPPRPADGGAPLDAFTEPGPDAGPPETHPRNERYLRGDLAQRLVIELDYVPGHEPLAGAEADLVARLETLVDKPAGIEIVRSDRLSPRGSDHAWTHEELGRLAAESFDDDPTPGTVVLHVLWVDGHDAGDEGGGVTLGLAFGHQFIVMFHESLRRACQSDPILGADVCREAQYLVWLHEVGHTLGLVDNGLDMVTPHRDADHGRHDESDECIMYWAFESRSGISSIRERLLGGSLPDFDDNCLADVARVRDR